MTVTELQVAALQIVLERHLSVRQTEELVRRRRRRGRGDESVAVRGDLQELESHLREILATRVAITRTRRGGRISIDFASDEELTRLFAWIIRTAPENDEIDPIPIGSEKASL